MQTLDVISVNLWQIVAALLNLLILFLIVKRFLYKPVKKMLESRQATIDGDYKKAEEAKLKAMADKKAYEEKLSDAKSEADSVIQSAVEIARSRENEILKEAQIRADGIVRQAEENAALEIRKAEAQVKREIIEVSTALTEKVLGREITAADHKQMIDSFIDGIGEEND